MSFGYDGMNYILPHDFKLLSYKNDLIKTLSVSPIQEKIKHLQFRKNFNI